jgi:hypothetical protein
MGRGATPRIKKRNFICHHSIMVLLHYGTAGDGDDRDVIRGDFGRPNHLRAFKELSYKSILIP